MANKEARATARKEACITTTRGPNNEHISEDLRGEQRKEVPKVEPDKAGENEEKKANPDEKKRKETDPKEH
jgi:hypothetical protein